jgi:hypothetical protein
LAVTSISLLIRNNDKVKLSNASFFLEEARHQTFYRKPRMTKFKLIAICLAAFGVLASGVGLLAQQSADIEANRQKDGPLQQKTIVVARVDPVIDTIIESQITTAAEICNTNIQLMERIFARIGHVNEVPSGDIPIWSRRWLDAQLRRVPGPAEKLAAIQAHLERVRRFEEISAQFAAAGLGQPLDALKAKYHRLEAERMFAEARTAHPEVTLPKSSAVREKHEGSPAPPSPRR